MSSSEEKTEQPSEHKLKEARKKGQVAKSQDCNNFLVFLLPFLGMLFLLPGAIFLWKAFFNKVMFFSFSKDNSLLPSLKESLNLWILLSLPLLLLSLFAAIFSNYLQFGFLFSTHPLKFKLEKINPIKGIKKIFSKDRLFELAKQVVKFCVVFYIAFLVLKGFLPNLLIMPRHEALISLSAVFSIFKWLTFLVLLGYLFVCIADYFWQKYAFLKSLRMSKYEVKKEYKQQEGDPMLKSERKRIAKESLDELPLKDMKKASAVLVNPTHLAVALFFDENGDEAPKILFKGQNRHASDIVRYARYFQVPIIRNISLARKLFLLDLDEEIPQGLYEVVADVLVLAKQIQEKQINHSSSIFKTVSKP